MNKLILLLSLVFISCSPIQLVENWKNPDIVLFDAYKVLIVGMAQDDEARANFESQLKKEFDKRDVEAMRSIDLFDVEFTSSEQSEKELDDFEQQLLDKDFDAIIFTKVIGSENIQTFRRRMSELDSYYGRFKDDYLGHQGIYYDADYYDQYTIYHAETSLYCICEGKERSLIWRGSIDITDPGNIDKAVRDYIKLVVLAMEEQNLIFNKGFQNEDTDSK